jgi:hypothetical protein
MKDILKQIVRMLEQTTISLAAWEKILTEQRPLSPGKLRDEREIAAMNQKSLFDSLRAQIDALPQ